jgi:hypothetical protein
MVLTVICSVLAAAGGVIKRRWRHVNETRTRAQGSEIDMRNRDKVAWGFAKYVYERQWNLRGLPWRSLYRLIVQCRTQNDVSPEFKEHNRNLVRSGHVEYLESGCVCSSGDLPRTKCVFCGSE